LIDTFATAAVNLETTQVELLKQLKHPNIVQYLGSEINETSTVFSLFLEFVSGGSIAKSLTERSAYSHRNANSHAPCSAARAHTAMCTRMQLKRPLPGRLSPLEDPGFRFSASLGQTLGGWTNA
jgi:hypothetical protein